MGDCGSMFLGFSLACLSLMGKSGLLSGNLFTALMMPTLVLATPLFDTTFVSLVRLLHGRSISQGGRDHTSHRLVILGLSERRAVFWLYGITVWFGLIALWGASIQNWLGTVAITVLSVIALLVLGLFLAEVQTYSEEEYARVRAQRYDNKTVLSRVVKHKRRFVEALLDFGLVCACWIAAYLLKFGVQLDYHARDLAETLPYVAACQMTALYVTGLYRGIWRYMTISDMGAALRGIFFGTVAAYFLMFLFAEGQPSLPSILIIDMTLLLVSVIGMRMGLKVLRYHFAVQWREGLRRVLIVGAGDAGELAVREMFNNQTLHLQPIGFIDDDPSKQQSSIHGIRVLGTRRQLLDIVNRLNVDEVVIAMPSIGNGVVQEMIDTCDQNGIVYREMRGVIL
jgi:UDP-GlcNAc:undecaprenyl-phosphate GlcNAc-1-phosphate transferase